jgi:hypothetical protein
VAPETAPPPGEPRLQAIAERDGRRVAMIDDRMLYEGDRSGDLLVIRIGEDEVEVEVKGQRRTLRF